MQGLLVAFMPPYQLIACMRIRSSVSRYERNLFKALR